MCREKAGGQDEMRMLRAMYAEGEERLRQAGIEEAGLDAWYLLEFVTGVDKAHYYMNPDRRMEQSVAQEYEKVVKLRTEHIPLQHITGVQEFMGLEFQVSGDVLIPRQDTEVLVEEAKKHIMPGCRLLDVCTGSGCILLSLLAECKDRIAMAMGVDISKDALQVAIANGNRMELPAEFRESDLFTHVTGTYDVIVSNPPYIATGELADLMPEVRDHEPVLALDGMEDGLYFYRKIVSQADGYLAQGGWLCFEIGYDQGAALKEMMTEAGYGQVQIIKDLAGLDRVAVGQKK